MRNVFLCTLLVVFCAMPLFAQYGPSTALPSLPEPNTYGTVGETAIAISAYAFECPDTCTFNVGPSGWRYATGGSGFFHASVELPEGAVITGIGMQVCDTNGGLGPIVDLARFFVNGNLQAVATVGSSLTTSGTPGCGLFRNTFGIPEVVNNVLNVYALRVAMPATDGSLQLGGGRVYYKLQVAPPPPTATFNDVPVGSPFHRFVEAMVAAGLTGGCGNNNFCPDAPVTRGQVAVFISAALGLHFSP